MVELAPACATHAEVCGCVPAALKGMLADPSRVPAPALADAEGARVPDDVPVFDAHVHLFPPRVFQSL